MKNGTNGTNWWMGYTRAIQTNLQVEDTARINPEKLAQDIADLGGNVLIFNVGGIYAWYHSDVRYHHVNEYLPEGRDLLKEVIDACHARDIRFVGRFDFSKAEDKVYQAHPDWFARGGDAQPQIIGAQRPGPWSLLYNTCIHSPYWNEAVAMPVLTEALSRYALDGVFFNATYPPVCRCEACRRAYRALYGKDMPDEPDALDPSWKSEQIRENITRLNATVKQARPGTPLILYYWEEQTSCIPVDEPLSEALCDESQDVLSRGLDRLTPYWRPAVRMKLLNLASPSVPPFGIIHSSPGMDWRHTGLPPAEYGYWVSLIPANGGSVWHSLTGIPETITDKRILEVIRATNERARAIEPAMAGARPVAQAVLLWDRAASNAGWLKALIDRQIPYGLIEADYVSAQSLEGYEAAIVPDGFTYSAKIVGALTDFVRGGGRLIVEGRIPEEFPGLSELCGLERYQTRSEYLAAAYLRVEEAGAGLRSGGMEDAALMAFRGTVYYSHPAGAAVLATLVPPFAPLEAVGAPPERASIPVPRTDIPLCLEHTYGEGRVLTLPFSLSSLIMGYGLADHVVFASNLVLRAIGTPFLSVTHYPGLFVSAFEKEGRLLLHFVNGVGSRPLTTLLPLRGIRVQVALDGTACSVRRLLGGGELPFTQEGGKLGFALDMDEVWEAVEIQTDRRP